MNRNFLPFPHNEEGKEIAECTSKKKKERKKNVTDYVFHFGHMLWAVSWIRNDTHTHSHTQLQHCLLPSMDGILSTIRSVLTSISTQQFKKWLIIALNCVLKL